MTLQDEVELLRAENAALKEKIKKLDKKRVRRSEYIEQATQILAFLNERTGKNFKPVDANLEVIQARLREGYTADDCRAVIAIQIRNWRGTDMWQYLRPCTLFCRSKFASYSGNVGEPVQVRRLVAL